MLCQVPAGLLIDRFVRQRRRILAFAVIGMSLTPLLLVLLPRSLPVFVAMLLQAVTTSLLSPAIAALSLSVAGRSGLGERVGRNARFGSIGAGAGALVMAACVWLGRPQAIFLIAVLLVIPTLLAIKAIGRDQPQPAPGTPSADTPVAARPWRSLLRDPRLAVFALCVVLFQVGSIGILQLAAVQVTARAGARAGIVIAAFVILPQIIVAWLSPAIGRAAERYGRRPVMLAGFATVPLRAALFALVRNPYALVPVQVLEGLGGGTFGILLPLVAADLTRRTGHYTLCISLLGLAGGLGTSISTALAGWVTDVLGRGAAYGLIAALLVAFAMPETRERNG